MDKIIIALLLFFMAPHICASGFDEDTFYELSVEGYNYGYNEIVDDAFFMKHEGFVLGASIVASTRFTSSWAESYFNHPECSGARLELLHSRGSNIDYKSNGTGTMGDSRHEIFEGRALIQYELENNIDLFSGLGIRFLRNDDSDVRSSTGHYGYLRESTYYYWPIGARHTYQINPEWLLKTSAEYDFLLSGRQYSEVNPPVTNSQNKGYGARLAIDFKQTGPGVGFIFGAFIRHWNVDDSDFVLGGSYYWREPKNRTFEAGLRVGVNLL